MTLHCQVLWASPADSAALRGPLDDGEAARYEAYRRGEDKARFVTGRALARTVVAERTGLRIGEIRFTTHCPYCDKSHGKPKVEGTGVEFSLSHSGDRVVLAVTEGVELGVDVEQAKGHDVSMLAEGVLTEPEQAALAALPEQDRSRAFYTYWSRKEALLKAIGKGLATPMTAITLSGPNDPAAVRSWPEGPVGNGVALVDLSAGEGYAAALAALTAEPVSVTEREVDVAALSLSP